MPTELVITELADSTDERGLSFSLSPDTLSHLKTIEDVHLAAIKPGHVRGNHYHVKKSELITVVYQDAWSLHWDSGPGTAVMRRSFSGTGAVSIIVPRYWSHAIRNDGGKDVWLFNASDMAFDRTLPDPADRDAPRREVV